MLTFTISELENFSGIKAHTIRIWEKRYNVLKPLRSEGNFRHYSLTEVAHLLDIALLTKNGYPISKVSGMQSTILRQEIHFLKTEEAKNSKAIKELIIAMYSTNIEEFETILNNCVLVWGIDKTIHHIIIPFLEKVNLLSYCNSNIVTHFVVTAIRKKIILAIESTKPILANQKTVLFFLPKEQHYDLVLLYLAYNAKRLGYKVLYLGTNISIDNIKMVSLDKSPDYFVTYIAPKHPFQVHDFAQFLNVHLPESKLFVTKSDTDTKQEESFHNVSFIHYNNVPAALEEVEQDYTQSN